MSSPGILEESHEESVVDEQQTSHQMKGERRAELESLSSSDDEDIDLSKVEERAEKRRLLISCSSSDEDSFLNRTEKNIAQRTLDTSLSSGSSGNDSGDDEDLDLSKGQERAAKRRLIISCSSDEDSDLNRIEQNITQHTLDSLFSSSSDDDSGVRRIDGDNEKDNEGIYEESELKFSELDPGVWPVNTLEWPPEKTQKMLLAIGIALNQDGKLSDRAPSAAISFLFRGRPREYGKHLVPSQWIRFKHQNFYDAAGLLFEFYTCSEQDQKKMKAQARLEKLKRATILLNMANLTSDATRASAISGIEGSKEIQEWWTKILSENPNKSSSTRPGESSSIRPAPAAAASWEPPKTRETFAKLYCIFYPFAAKDPDAKTIQSVLGRRPRGYATSMKVPKKLKAVSSDVYEVVEKIFDYLVLKREEQKEMRKKIERDTRSIHYRTLKANESKLCSKVNIQRIISEFPHLKVPFVDKYITPGWDDMSDDDHDTPGVESDYVGRASLNSMRMETVEREKNANKAKAYKRPKSGDFCTKERQFSLSQKQGLRNASIQSNAKYMDSVHIARNPLANINESMIAIYLTNSNVNKNSGGFLKQSDQKADKTKIIVLRDTKEHLNRILETLQEAKAEEGMVEAGTMAREDMKYEVITLERPGSGARLKDHVHKELIKPYKECRKNPAKKSRSIGSQHDQHNIQSEGFGVQRPENNQNIAEDTA